MHHFQNGEAAKILKHGVEVEVVVFRQLGEFVYAFDKGNRAYQFRVKDVLPVREQSGAISGLDSSRNSAPLMDPRSRDLN